MNLEDIQELMEVVGSCGNHVGRVDGIEGHSIKLARGGDDEHHYVPLEWVEGVGQTVRLRKTAEEVREQWHSAPLGTTA